LSKVESLEKYLSESVGYEIENKEDVQGALRKIKKYQEEIREIYYIADQEVKKVRDWEFFEVNKIQEKMEDLEAKLEGFMAKEIEKNPDKKSLSLPDGRIRYKKQQPNFIFDEGKTIEYLKAHYPDLVKINESFSKTDAKKLVKENGEVWEGVEIENRPDKFEVVIKDD